MALDVTDATFEEVVLKSDKPVLVDFWATWCGPCKMIAPAIEALAADFDGKAIVTKVDVDNNNESAASYGVRNIPTILFFKGGEVVDKHVGVATKDVLAAKLNALV
ncbi:bifunctional thioredoxin reductase/thioredoxin [Flavobacteriaceae bacterium UJ101]|nr:bifunctional thioredoxin reductase/thioredoxin [Flavobacteriaceae bacterium UJ101]